MVCPWSNRACQIKFTLSRRRTRGGGRHILPRRDTANPDAPSSVEHILSANPYTRSLINNLNSLSEVDGAGLLIADGMIVYTRKKRADGQLMMVSIAIRRPSSMKPHPSELDNWSITNRLPGYPWAMVLTIPAQETQQIAIDIALPISLMIILLGIVALVLMRVNLRAVTGSLQSLATEAKYLSTGKLDRPLNVDGEDEISELRRAFEQMRINLQARLAGSEPFAGCQSGSCIQPHTWRRAAPGAGCGRCEWRKFCAHRIGPRDVPNTSRDSIAFRGVDSSRMCTCILITRSWRSPSSRNDW